MGNNNQKCNNSYINIDTINSEPNKNNPQNRPHIPRVPTTVEEKLRYIFYNIVKDLPTDEMEKPLFAKPINDTISELSRVYAALIISICGLQEENTKIEKNTIQTLLKDPEGFPLQDQIHYQKLYELLSSIFSKKLLQISQDNNTASPTLTASQPYHIRPTASLSNALDLANKIRDCVLHEKTFKIATICCPMKNSGNQKPIQAIPLLLSYNTQNRKFLLTINNEDFFENLQELCDHHIFGKEEVAVTINNTSRTHNQFSAFYLPASAKHQKKPDPNCNNNNYYVDDLSDSEEKDDRAPLLSQ